MKISSVQEIKFRVCVNAASRWGTDDVRITLQPSQRSHLWL
ncbi:hypothetical protein FOWG_16027 [Fusarium oxysporum f. sp. lycopersici MN25]|uniref:Uncharacterized protein n=1 Tax=Fusarium oxysporum Fo47 TaxID=660027 RepID=W9JXM4_FUSOX|nr:hypothetical protein FOZG_13643 [Fusarium oxysporum Fo47]EWZ79865.1 hypothetical protein FOWG_16027 [Fusarium oxysporum f. sp. lycopersici MN25]